MKYVNTNDENFFDPTPKLKSSPIQIKFISFNRNDCKCFYCGEEYIKALFCSWQKYCIRCLSHYVNEITADNNIYLDLYLFTMNLKCNEHEISKIKESQNIHECCRNCFQTLCFKQIPIYYFYYKVSSPYYNLYKNMIESEKNCKLCGKTLQELEKDKFKLCSDCYLISSGYIKSTLNEKPIPIINLPWWHNISRCDECKLKLTFTSESQKYCVNCYIVYTGCRYCLTTNVIFGFTSFFGSTNQSQCKKCKRVSSIIFDITNFNSGNSDLDEFLLKLRLDCYSNLKLNEFIDEIKNNNTHFCPLSIFNSINQDAKTLIEWVPYSQFTNIKEIAKGGFGIIYTATWLEGSINKILNIRKRRENETVILKRFENSRNISKYFLNENLWFYKGSYYILVIQYAPGGDLHNYLQKNFTEITWNKQKLAILWQISEGLETIHKAEFIHRDLHSGNILSSLLNGKRYQWQIGDLGLSQPINSTSSNNEIYGVIPYIAPEIFKGSVFSKNSDVYCIGMIMWELTTGRKPFDNVEHDINLVYKILDGERPEITEDTPECYANLMKSCWNSDPKKRPTIIEIRKTIGKWFFTNKNIEPFNQAELKRKELISLDKLGPNFARISHPRAVYTSRSLSFLISKCSSINHSKEYTSIELDFDIDIESQINRSKVHGTKRNIEELDIDSHGDDGKYLSN
ncbi:kinase-like domain-containing protein [Rhizophagus clarus]|uniref:Kinase-like domain-containing protein n=2 Tax=Rhizophagus clarus TaxID=94130 RepID=A0A8H3QJ81_9GLOM|nr:kinase-like domain-containing protein [Rhizophagus clarus]